MQVTVPRCRRSWDKLRHHMGGRPGGTTAASPTTQPRHALVCYSRTISNHVRTRIRGIRIQVAV